jgi:hypothetical protein
MKKLFYRLSSRQPFARLFSMLARLDERRRDMFPRSSVFAVVALAAFVSLGALLFPQVVQAQCVWDCDLGSDPSNNPWGNSPQSPDIAYCIDRGCVLNLKDSSGNQIFTGNNIPTPQVKQIPSSQNCSDPTRTVTIIGNVVVLLRDQKGNLDPKSAAQADLNIVINGVTCSGDAGETILSRVVTAGQTNVFGTTSSISIQPPIPNAWKQSCGNLNQACVFPLGLEVFNTANDVAKHLPATGPFSTGEAYRAEESTRFVGVRDCKGDANGLPSTIACSNGEILTGGDAQALFTFTGNWSGAEGHTINPNSGNNPFDMLLTPQDFNGIRFLPNTVFASANNGPEVPTNGCNDQVNQNTERCFFTASALLPNGCKGKTPVAVQVTGKLIRLSDNAEFKFVSKDNPTCSK